VGEVAVTNHQSLLQTGTTRCRDGVTGSRSPMMRPKTLPDSQAHTGKTRRSLSHHWSAESRHTPPKLRIARPRFLCDGVLAQREDGVTRRAVVPMGTSPGLWGQLVKARPMQLSPGGAHGLTATDKERFNADLLAFLGVSTANPTRFSWQILGQRGKDRATEPV